MSDYQQEAKENARETAENFLDEIVKQLWQNATNKASDDLYNDYPDGDAWHHERHIDRFYPLADADELLNELSEFEEEDSGLWEGAMPREAIGVQAAFTYGNAVLSRWDDLIAYINDRYGDWADEWEHETKTFEGEGLTGRSARLLEDARVAVEQWIDEF